MSEGGWLEAVHRLLRLVDSYGLAELVVEEDGLKVTIRGGETGQSPEPLLLSGTPAPASSRTIEESPLHAVVSPMTGVFYRSASPDAPPFVEPGDRVEEGQVIGLIEAMKVFSEIPADRSGRVAKVLVPDGQLVSQGDTLMLLDLEG